MSENEEVKTDTVDEAQTAEASEDTPISPGTDDKPAEDGKNAETPETSDKKKKGGSKNPFRNKKFRHGSLSIVFTAIFIAAVVLVNVIFNLVLDRFGIEADLTTGSVFTLSDETEDYIAGVEDDVSFYVTAERDSLNTAGNIYKQTVEFLDKMCSLNRRFGVTYVNLLSDPDFSNDYVEDLKNYQVIVKSGKTGRYRILSIGDFMKYTLSDGKTYSYSEASMYVSYYGYTVTSYSSVAEEEIVSAVQSVSLEDPTVVTFLTGYGESDSSSLEKILTDNAYVTQNCEIERVEAVPEDTDILVIHGATKDYSRESITKVDEWLSNNGKYGKRLIYIATADAAETPGLDEYLREWGLEIGRGYILQYNTDHAYFTGSSLPVMQDIEMKDDTAYYENMKQSSSAKFVGYYARPVIPLWEEEGNFANVTIASTYGDQCLMFPFTADENWSPSQADLKNYSVIVEASKVQFSDNNQPIYSKIVAVGGDQLFTSYFTSASNYSNGEAALALFDTNSDKSSNTIKIVEKSFTAESYQIDRSTQLAIGITFAIVIPVIIIVIGIVVWARRRRL